MVYRLSFDEMKVRMGIDIAEQNFTDHVAVDFSRWQQSADIESRVIALEAKIANKTPSQEDTVDITQTAKSPATFTVNNALGGVLKYKISAILGLVSLGGSITINNETKSGGLLSVPGLSGTIEVPDGAVITAVNMESLTFTPYIAA
jgi:hypothetical protein